MVDEAASVNWIFCDGSASTLSVSLIVKQSLIPSYNNSLRKALLYNDSWNDPSEINRLSPHPVYAKKRNSNL